MSLRERKKKSKVLNPENFEETHLKLSDIEEMYTLRPTSEEFGNLVEYIENLYKRGIWKYGTIKIIPPSEFKPKNCFDKKSSKKLEPRIQVLYNMSQGLVSILIKIN